MSCTRRGIGIAHRSGRRWTNRSSWMEGLVLGLLVAVPAVIAALSGYSAVQGQGFIPHEGTLEVAFLPY